MSKNILLIEDDGYMSETIKNELDKNYDNVELAYSYESAVDCWGDDDNVKNFDCIIIDLHINPRGMEIEEVVRYNPYYGIAVYDYFKDNPCKESSKRLEQKTILYSGYIEGFKQYCKLHKGDYKKLVQIDKNESSSFNKLINKIDKICNE